MTSSTNKKKATGMTAKHNVVVLNTQMTYWALNQNRGKCFDYADVINRAEEIIRQHELTEVDVHVWAQHWAGNWFKNFGKMAHRCDHQQ